MLFTLVSCVMTITDCWKLIHRGVGRENTYTNIGIQHFTEHTSFGCFPNSFYMSIDTPVHNLTLLGTDDGD